MTPERAIDINDRLVMAYMVRERLNDNEVPDLSDVSLTEAVEASQIMAARSADPFRHRDTFTCHVAPSRVHTLYFWAIAKRYEMEIEA